MQDLPLGPLLFLIVLILVPFINALLQRIRRRFEGEVPQEPPRQPAPRTYAKPPSFEPTASAGERTPVPEIVETSPRTRRRIRNKIYFTSRRDLRRAIILMAVLGPCRAVESADPERRQFPQ